jgi:endonuclease-3
MPRKRPFDVDEVLSRIRETVPAFADAAMFELAERGHHGLFAQLVACIISIRTLDEVSLPASIRLLERARDAASVAALDPDEIDALIRPSTFHERKATQIHEIARRTVTEHGGELPCDYGVLTAFSGVGPKCASLALGIACGGAHIAVDVHVHRVTNRWGYVRTPHPEATMAALTRSLPAQYWVEINRLLVPFGKHVCTRARPHCSTCPVLEFCRQVGVTDPR